MSIVRRSDHARGWSLAATWLILLAGLGTRHIDASMCRSSSIASGAQETVRTYVVPSAVRESADGWRRCVRAALEGAVEIRSCDQRLDSFVRSALGSPSNPNILEMLYAVFRESIEDSNADKKYYLSKLRMQNEIAEKLSDYLDELTKASQKISSREPDSATRAVLEAAAARGSTEARLALDQLRAPAQTSDVSRHAVASLASGVVGLARASATRFDVEAETIVQSGKFQVTGGQVGAQSMAGFGPGWSGDAQLLWLGGAAGAVLDLVIEVPAAGSYAIEVYVTRAPDYAQVRMEVEGQASAVTWDGYAPNVLPPAAWQIGTFSLQAGPQRISFMIAGRHQQAVGYLVGVD